MTAGKYDSRAWMLAASLCPHCAAGAPHHTNSATSIGGSDRHIVYDIHEIEDTGGVGLAECLAYDEVWSKLGLHDA